MRELESSLQRFGEFLLKSAFVKETAAPYCVRYVRQYLTRPTTDDPLTDRVRRFYEDLKGARRIEGLATRVRSGPARFRVSA